MATEHSSDAPFVEQLRQALEGMEHPAYPMLAKDKSGPEYDGPAPCPGAWLSSLSSAERKLVPLMRGLFAYFPDALGLVARHSARSNEKHNPGQPIHWARGKSTDHGDCELRHAMAVAIDPDAQDDGQYEMICKAWRALADLQAWAERKMTYEGRID